MSFLIDHSIFSNSPLARKLPFPFCLGYDKFKSTFRSLTPDACIPSRYPPPKYSTQESG